MRGDATIGLVKIINTDTAISRVLEWLATVSVTAVLRMFAHLSVADTTSTNVTSFTTRDMFQQPPILSRLRRTPLFILRAATKDTGGSSRGALDHPLRNMPRSHMLSLSWHNPNAEGETVERSGSSVSRRNPCPRTLRSRRQSSWIAYQRLR
jgi:hypothetical protein